jgi:WD40 repeat protein
MSIYRKAFMRHDESGFRDYLNSVEKGETKINASTLYPYDVVEKYLGWNALKTEDKTLELQWKALPNYVGEGVNAIVMADVSGSMRMGSIRPMATSIGLAIYFAERNTGAYHNLFMTFSGEPKIMNIKGETLKQKVDSIKRIGYISDNTNLVAAFDKVLEIAEDNHVPQDEMPKAIIVISDMEIDSCGNENWSFYDKMKHRFEKNGYTIPNIIFWNVNSRHDVFHADSTREGVQLASGQSVTVFKQILTNLGYNPVEAMENVINSRRYDCITVS